MRPLTHRLALALAAASLALAVLVPAAALATPADDSCASLRTIPFVTPVPDDIRTAGVHRFERRSTWSDADGNAYEETIRNQIAIDAKAPAYPNTVLLRIYANTTLLADGSVIDVDAMRPDQAATFYAAAYSTKDDTAFLDSFRMWFRYETSRNHWTAWTEVQRGPETNFCNQVTNAAWKKTYGWD